MQLIHLKFLLSIIMEMVNFQLKLIYLLLLYLQKWAKYQ